MQAQPKISIVEDDVSLRDALVGFLRSLGYDAAGFACAEDFLSAGRPESSDCVVTDIRMPGLSGIELKNSLAASGIRVPVIMITAQTEGLLHRQALESGAARVFKKPFDSNELVDCIRCCLGQHS